MCFHYVMSFQKHLLESPQNGNDFKIAQETKIVPLVSVCKVVASEIAVWRNLQPLGEP